jgi:6-pyruvoyltetrahydropterin/6-carboxytetrahydropterin synthase
MSSPIVELEKSFRFEAAHHLPNVSEGHRCARVHGHSYRLTVRVKGTVDPQMGWFVDYGEINEVVKPIVEALDHRDLNLIPGLENPTTEAVCVWIWNRIASEISGLDAVEVAETENTSCVYRGEQA